VCTQHLPTKNAGIRPSLHPRYSRRIALIWGAWSASAAGVAAYKTAGCYDSMHPERPFLMYVALFEYMYIGAWSRATWIQLRFAGVY
jgi:hypothetical protein